MYGFVRNSFKPTARLKAFVGTVVHVTTAQPVPVNGQEETDVKKLVRLVSAVTSLSIAAIIGSAGVATADTDSYTYDHVEVGAQNNGSAPTAWICNEQSSENYFKFWVYSAYYGNLSLTPGTGWLIVQLGNNVYEVHLYAGECKWVYTHMPVTVQVYAGSGSLSWGTDPIAWSP